jgi:hypothetical protein
MRQRSRGKIPTEETMSVGILALATTAGAREPAATWTIEQNATTLTISSSTPRQFRITAEVGTRPGELLIEVDLTDDGRPEAGCGIGGCWNNGLAGSYRRSCNSRGFMAEFETASWFPTGKIKGEPYVLVEHYDDGNVHVVFYADRDGRPGAEATTEFVLETPERSPVCAENMPTPSSVPRPR